MTYVVKNAKGAIEERAVLLDEVQHISDKAKRERRDLTEDEANRVDEILDVEIPKMDKIIKRERKIEQEAGVQDMMGTGATPLTLADGPDEDYDYDNPVRVSVRSRSKPQASEWINKETGKPQPLLSKGQPLCETESGLSLARFMTAKFTGDWRHAQAEMRAAQQEGDNSLGGTLVPNELSRWLIDRARERSVMTRLGMLVAPMGSETLRIARIASDPTISTVAENSEIPASTVGFDSILLTASKSACLVPTSDEVLDDAENFGSILVGSMTSAVATEMDRQMLVGALGSERTGLVENDNINETGSIGAISYDDVHDAVVAVMGRNEMPNGYVAASEIIGDLTKEKTSGSGEYLGPSPLVAPLMREHTEHLTTANLLVGDFSQCIMGLRGNIEVATDSSGTYFSKYQHAFRVVVRWDFGVMRENAFQRLAGITTT